MTIDDRISNYADSKGRRPYLSCDPRHIEYRPEEDDIRARLAEAMPDSGEVGHDVVSRLADIGMRYGVDAHRFPDIDTSLIVLVIHSRVVRRTGIIQSLPPFSDQREEIEAMEMDSVGRLAEVLRHMENLIQIAACSNLIDLLEGARKVAGIDVQARIIEATRPHITWLAPDNRKILEDYIEECGPAHS
ncbi:hypothetical protein [uncultured Salinicola sp.]|mgnify:CR=1 FL=1|uniref:hypothetical protein n=1 Tax=uncultured Salinicola sp. TaxID=1193542 RepID=UPI00260F634B|nr:hypothetical protein [uncultured Salinicola sp.]|tara:strand:- start:1549 stop:2115 length:567 start_codon:yes stop_codon:yes gene_type:complete